MNRGNAPYETSTYPGSQNLQARPQFPGAALVASFRLFTQTLTASGKEKEIWDPSGKGP